MALRPCRECGKDVSTEAASCPHCGVGKPVAVAAVAPKPKKRSRLKLLLVGGLALIVVFNLLPGDGSPSGIANSPPAAPRPAPENDPDFGAFVIAQGKSTIKSALKDPESVRWGAAQARVMEVDGKSAVVACGTYNSKNSMGGYTGSRRFISNGGELTWSEEQMPAGEFNEAWKLMCNGRVLAESPADGS